MNRLEEALNKPAVVLVVGVVAVALNALLYFGYYLPRTAPLIERIPSISASLPEAISKPFSEASSNSHLEGSGKSHLKAGANGGKSVPEASRESASNARPNSPPENPSGSSPESSTPQQQQQPPTPQQQQYQ